jgi:hypothetical protein
MCRRSIGGYACTLSKATCDQVVDEPGQVAGLAVGSFVAGITSASGKRELAPSSETDAKARERRECDDDRRGSAISWSEADRRSGHRQASLELWIEVRSFPALDFEISFQPGYQLRRDAVQRCESDGVRDAPVCI